MTNLRRDGRKSRVIKKATLSDVRRKVIARLLPVRPKAEAYPDFAAIRKQIFGDKRTLQTGTDLVSEARGRYSLSALTLDSSSRSTARTTIPQQPLLW